MTPAARSPGDSGGKPKFGCDPEPAPEAEGLEEPLGDFFIAEA